MAIAVNVEGVGRVNFPDDYTPERIQFAIENDILPRMKAEQPATPKAAEPSMLDQVGRQVGLTARAAVRGVTAIPGALADVVVQGVNAVTGANLPIPTEAQDRNMARAGLPTPANATERVAGDVTEAMAGQGLIAKIAQTIKAGGPAAQRILDILGAQPKAQVIAAGSGAAGSSVAKEGGAGPMGQMAAGIAAGAVLPTAADVTVEAVKAGGRAVSAAVKPFTTEGRKQVVGSALNKAATNPKQAMENMGAADELVPDSKPTAAQAARDEGLLIAERGLASSSPAAGARMGRRASEQNAARNLVLNAMAGDDAALEAAKAARGAETTASREAAFAGKKPVDMAPVEAKIDAILASPKGKRETVAGAMEWLRGRLKGVTDPEELYAIRQDVGDVLAGKLQGDRANLRLATGQLVEVRDVLDGVIESGAPGFRAYLSEYASKSKPINQMETLQGVRGKVLNAGTDAATGERLLSQAKFSNAVNKPESRAELKKLLTPEQFKNLEAISADLDRAALSASSGKAAGSNTTQNLSTAYVLGQTLSGKVAESPITRNLARPLGWLNKLNEAEIQELMADAMLDPKLARTLMAGATPARVEGVGYELLQRARARGIAAAIESRGSTTQPAEEK